MFAFYNSCSFMFVFLFMLGGHVGGGGGGGREKSGWGSDAQYY